MSLSTFRFPIEPGSYALLLHTNRGGSITVGRKGQVIFPAGDYVYLGSARGPGGLSARLNRHLRREKTRRWHIDYFLDHASIQQVWTVIGPEKWECVWAKQLLGWPASQIIFPQFGSSDCHCPSHLIFWATEQDWGKMRCSLSAVLAFDSDHHTSAAHAQPNTPPLPID